MIRLTRCIYTFQPSRWQGCFCAQCPGWLLTTSRALPSIVPRALGISVEDAPPTEHSATIATGVPQLISWSFDMAMVTTGTA